MITVSLSKTAAEGSSYFDNDDGYYAAPAGASRWYGRGAEELGLVGEVNKLELDAVLYGYNPRTGDRLVANADAEDIKDADGKVIKRGRVAYIDVHAAPPKSVSILSLIDHRIEEQAHNCAVEKIKDILETEYTFTRRANEYGIIDTVKSDNLTIARINHYESRDLDPQLHSHLVVMNLTHGEDGKWRSIDAGKIYSDQIYLGQIYRNDLAKGIKKLGYEVEVTDPAKGFFEVKGVPLDIIEKYSKRRKSIEKKLEEYEEKGAYKDLSNREKAQKACLATRRKKRGITLDELREGLETDLVEIGQSLTSIRDEALRYGAAAAPEPPRSAEQCVRTAIGDVMNKQSAATEKAIIDQALKGSMGYYTADELAAVLRGQSDWEMLGSGANDKYPATYYTTTATRQAEQDVISYAMGERGQYGRAITADTVDRHLARIAADGKQLTDGQFNAVRMICITRDRVSIVQGDAGAGKTTAMEAVRKILASEGIMVRGFAPTGKASEELNAAGVEARTIHKYLEDLNAQSKTGQGEVWLVDEAGMIGSRKLHEFLKKAEEKQARVILVGDTKQFQSVEQGKLFQSLQDRRACQKTEITEVKRQKTEHAKTIVKAIKDEDFETAFKTLDRHGGLEEIADRDERIQNIVNEFIGDRDNGTESVVLTANNADKDEINGNIRSILAKTGAVQSGEAYEMFQKYNINNTTKSFGRAYTDGQIIITRRDCGDIPRGTQAAITKIDIDNDIINIKYYNKKTRQYDYADIKLRQNAAKFDVYNRYNRHFGVGDRVIFTKNDKRVGVSNGQTGTITEIDGDGNAKIQVGKKIVDCNLHNRGDKGYTYIDYAYCLTTHKSQGSTYDKVIVNADVSQQKTNYNAFYVQATRARYDISIITDDRDKLVKQAAVHENKISTLDAVFEDSARQQQIWAAEIRAEEAEFAKNAEKAKKNRIEKRIIEKRDSVEWRGTPDYMEKWFGKMKEALNNSMTIDKIKKEYYNRYEWHDTSLQQVNGNSGIIVARQHDKQQRNNNRGLFAIPQEDGKIVYEAVMRISNPKPGEEKTRQETCNSIQEAKMKIDRDCCIEFLLIQQAKEKELAERKKAQEIEREKAKEAKAIKEKETKPKSSGIDMTDW